MPSTVRINSSSAVSNRPRDHTVGVVDDEHELLAAGRRQRNSPRPGDRRRCPPFRCHLFRTGHRFRPGAIRRGGPESDRRLRPSSAATVISPRAMTPTSAIVASPLTEANSSGWTSNSKSTRVSVRSDGSSAVSAITKKPLACLSSANLQNASVSSKTRWTTRLTSQAGKRRKAKLQAAIVSSALGVRTVAIIRHAGRRRRRGRIQGSGTLRRSHTAGSVAEESLPDVSPRGIPWAFLS